MVGQHGLRSSSVLTRSPRTPFRPAWGIPPPETSRMPCVLPPSAPRPRPSECSARPVDLDHVLVVHSVRPAPGAATEDANVLSTLLATRLGKVFYAEFRRDSPGSRRVSLSQAGEMALCYPVASTRLDRRWRGGFSMGRLLFRTRPVRGRCRRQAGKLPLSRRITAQLCRGHGAPNPVLCHVWACL